ncbi:hypothetical protein I5770_01120 [Brucella sp. BO2]|uniref:hypothetical protein n=1 Tax=Brucella sp. BO2 TaxID=693750 RepID=UPI00046D1757|nr:hypothetical protein [Brucella sp. BO2]QPN27287.1 hypothetical protein I5770_01120 [Brucella sp. BO2]
MPVQFFKKVAAIAVISPFVASCAMTLPVRGQMTNGSETFTGKATGYADGGGTLEITSNRGRKCSGTFTCSDGTSGPFQFVSTGTRGTGTGTLSGKAFTFTFG